MTKKLILIALVGLIAASSSWADRRKYAFTYQNTTMPEGASEIEFYQTTKLDVTNSWEYRIEVEQGLSPRWDMSVYQIFAQEEGESFKWDAVQIRTRYRLAPYGKLFMNPLLYLEYNRKIDLKRQNKLEAKLLFAQDFEKVNLAINPVYEFFWAPGDPVHEFGCDIGLSYAPSFRFSFGVESLFRYEVLKNEENETGAYFGPGFSFASGNNYYTFSYLWGLTDDSNDARVRFLMGVGL